jgi:hypothetical protein
LNLRRGKDPGSEIRKKKSSRILGVKRYRIPDPDPQHCLNQVERDTLSLF